MYTKHRWESDRYFNFGYVQYLPKNYDKTQSYPLVFFLHGAGERGEDLDVAMRYGFMQHVRESGAEYPFILIGPQCPTGKFWACYTESLLAFLDYICETLPVDRDRVYLTGISMGGTGTWMLAMADPARFAAIAPICGSGIVWNGGVLAKTPILVYHGDNDQSVPIHESMEMLRVVNRRGGNAQIKVIYGAGHNVWDLAYSGDELYTWLLSHQLTHHDQEQNNESEDKK